MLLQFVSILLLQSLHSPLIIYLNVIIARYSFSDRHVFANLLEHCNLIFLLAPLILLDFPYFGANKV